MESSSISASQLTYLAIGFLLGTSVILFPGSAAENNAWLAVIAGLAEGLVFLAIYNALASQYPRKTLVEINDIVLGPYFGKMFTLAYLLFFVYVGSEVLRTFVEFMLLLMPLTPVLVFMIPMLLVTGSAVRNGIEVMARCSQIIVVLSVAVFGLIFVMALKDFDLSNLLPVMDIPLKKFFLASHSVAALPFGEVVVFLMVLPLVREPSQARRAMGKAFFSSAALLALSALLTSAVLGPLARIATYPSFSAIRVIRIADVFTRLEVIPAFALFFLGFAKFIVFYYGIVLGISQTLKMRTYKPLILPIGALIGVTSLLLYDSYVYDLIDANMLFPFYSMIFAFFLPLITLIVARIRKSRSQQEADHAR